MYFFRASDFERAISILKSMFDTQYILVSDYLIYRVHYWGFDTETIKAYGSVQSYVDVDSVIHANIRFFNCIGI